MSNWAALGARDEVVSAPERDARRDTIVRTLEQYVTVIPPTDVAWEWRGGDLVEIPVADFTDDTDGFIVRADEIEVPTIDDLAGTILSDLDELASRPAAWRYWRFTSWLAGRLYVLGVVSGYCIAMSGRHTRRGSYIDYVHWSFFGGPYKLGKPRWWWECHRRQGWTLRGRHRPLRPFALGLCAACCPCPDCGAPYECREGCIR